MWTPDGNRIAFSSQRGDRATANLYLMRADGTGEPQRLLESKNVQFPGSWDLSGKYLSFVESRGPTRVDIMILPVEGDEASGWKPGTPSVFLATPSTEKDPQFSPDGRWLAYASDESGRHEVYVRPFPAAPGRWQV